MNYCKLIVATLFLWAILAPGVFFLWGVEPLRGASLGTLACLAGFLAAEKIQKEVKNSYSKISSAGFLLGGVSRVGFPIIFLLFSIFFYRRPLDKTFLFAIIVSYFVFYPYLLVWSVIIALRYVGQADIAETQDEQ